MDLAIILKRRFSLTVCFYYRLRVVITFIRSRRSSGGVFSFTFAEAQRQHKHTNRNGEEKKHTQNRERSREKKGGNLGTCESFFCRKCCFFPTCWRLKYCDAYFFASVVPLSSSRPVPSLIFFVDALQTMLSRELFFLCLPLIVCSLVLGVVERGDVFRDAEDFWTFTKLLLQFSSYYNEARLWFR